MAKSGNPYHIPSIPQQLSHPIKLLARILDFFFSLLRPSDVQVRRNICLVCISDTHCLIPDFVPYGDVLIHAGDMTNAGTPAEIQAQIDWLSSLPHRYKVVVAGNHDTWLDPRSRRVLSPADRDGTLDWKDVIYLADGAATLSFPERGGNGAVRVYGNPQTPDMLGPEHAFEHSPRGTDVWTGRMPTDADVVVTHGPPKYHLDLPGVRAMGDEFLLRELRRVRPRVHVFGHIHAGKSDFLGRLRGGQEVLRWDATELHFEGAVQGLSRGDVAQQLRALYHLLLLAFCGVVAVARELLLGSDPPQISRLVNAALVYNDSGKIGYEPQVVYI